MISLNWF